MEMLTIKDITCSAFAYWYLSYAKYRKNMYNGQNLQFYAPYVKYIR